MSSNIVNKTTGELTPFSGVPISSLDNIKNDINNIKAVIPSNASSSNKLSTKGDVTFSLDGTTLTITTS